MNQTNVDNEKVNILIVDDRQENLLALEAILERLEQNLVKANSGDDALRCLLDQDFALILLDVQMPDMDGFETAKLIRQREKTRYTPIIFLTAINRTENHVHKGYSLGAVDYIFKPLDPEILISKVNVFVELFRKNKLLKEQLRAYKELEAFTYTVAHDLGAPLRVINSFSSILLSEYGSNLDDEGQKYLKTINSRVMQMKELIDDLLNFSRVTHREVEKVEVNMNDLVSTVIKELTEPNNKEIRISLQELPQIQGDRSMIKQVLVNLISNAIKFTKNISKPEIEIGCKSLENENIFYVKDNGVGFDMKYVNKLFNIFQRLHKQNEFEGTGVGLAIVRHIIQKHNGYIYAESRLNEGATFYLGIPKEEKEVAGSV